MIDNQVLTECQQVGPDAPPAPQDLVRDLVARAVVNRLDGFTSVHWKPEESQSPWEAFSPLEQAQAKWVADAAIAAHLEALIEMELPEAICLKGVGAIPGVPDQIYPEDAQLVFRAILKVLLSQHKGESDV